MSSSSIQQSLQALKQLTEELYKSLNDGAQSDDFKPGDNELQKLRQHQLQVLEVLKQYMLSYTTSLEDLKLFSTDLTTLLRLLNSDAQQPIQKTECTELLDVQEWLKEVVGDLADASKEEGAGGSIIIRRYPR